MKSVYDDNIKEMVASGSFRVANGRIETNRKWNGHRDLTVPWYVCDRLDGKGYLYVSYHMARVKAHRLAYVLHRGVDLDDFEINHLDGNPLNNTIENLELCGPSRQSQHAFDTGLNKNRGELHQHAKLNADMVREARGLRSLGVPYTKLARKFGVTPRAIYLACKRKTWAHVE